MTMSARQLRTGNNAAPSVEERRGFDKFVRAGRGEGSGNWPETMEMPATMGLKRSVWKFQKIFRDRNENRSHIKTGLENWSQLETEFGDQKLSRSLIETKSFGPVADVGLLFESTFLILERFRDRNEN